MSAQRKDAGGPVLDPVQLALTQNRLDYVTRQMGDVMVRTARSPIFSQAHDFTCFVCGPDGWLVSQADGIPIHSGGGGFAVRAVLRDFEGDVEPGDVFVLNDPWQAGGNHLPDWVIARPVFVEGRRVAFACNRAHQSDIGGGAPGTYNPLARDTWQEGGAAPRHEARLPRRDPTRSVAAAARQLPHPGAPGRRPARDARRDPDRRRTGGRVRGRGLRRSGAGPLRRHPRPRPSAGCGRRSRPCRTGSTRAPTTPTTTASSPATSRCGRASPSRATVPG